MTDPYSVDLDLCDLFDCIRGELHTRRCCDQVHASGSPPERYHGARPPRVVGIVDWEQSVWLPDYWKHVKPGYYRFNRRLGNKISANHLENVQGDGGPLALLHGLHGLSV